MHGTSLREQGLQGRILAEAERPVTMMLLQRRAESLQKRPLGYLLAAELTRIASGSQLQP